MSNLQLMKIHLYFGKMGSLCGQWVCTKEAWDEDFLKRYRGRTFYVHDELGKHSEIKILVDELKEDVQVVTRDQKFLNTARDLGISLNSGWCPLNYAESIEEDIYYEAHK